MPHFDFAKFDICPTESDPPTDTQGTGLSDDQIVLLAAQFCRNIQNGNGAARFHHGPGPWCRAAVERIGQFAAVAAWSEIDADGQTVRPLMATAILARLDSDDDIAALRHVAGLPELAHVPADKYGEAAIVDGPVAVNVFASAEAVEFPFIHGLAAGFSLGFLQLLGLSDSAQG